MTSRKYETMYIIHPDLGSEDTNDLITTYKEMVQELGGELDNIDDWGMRRLAYEIDDLKEGYYVIMQYKADHSAIEELERRMGLNDNIVRFMTVRDDA